MFRRPWFVTALLIVAIAVTGCAAPSESDRFNRWLDASWEETLQRDPILATTIGDTRYNSQMVDTGTEQWRADNRSHIESHPCGADQHRLVRLAGW